jgi:hypothetical protein
MARYREDMKEWDRRAKLRDRKTQGGRRDYWAELLARDGPPPAGLRVIPECALSYKLKFNRTETLKKAEVRRQKRMEQQTLLVTEPKPEKPWRKPIKNAEDMKAWLKASTEKLRQDNAKAAQRMEEQRRLCGYIDTPEKRAEIRARAELLAEVRDKDLRNHGYANRSTFMNSADESADLEDQGLCPIMDDGFDAASTNDD